MGYLANIVQNAFGQWLMMEVSDLSYFSGGGVRVVG